MNKDDPPNKDGHMMKGDARARGGFRLAETPSTPHPHTSGSWAVEGCGNVCQLGRRVVSVVSPACSWSRGPANGAGQTLTSRHSCGPQRGREGGFL